MSAPGQGGNHHNVFDPSAQWPLSLLPVGYRFKPSDEVLVGDFLRRKIDGHLTAPLILEFDVFGTEPWNFPGDVVEERYFFCRMKNEANSGDSRVVGDSGYWKLTGTEKEILTPTLNAVKSRLLFREGGEDEDDDDDDQDDDDDSDDDDDDSDDDNQTRPKWIMHEFRPQYQENQIERDQWAVYRVLPKKTKRPKGSRLTFRFSLQELLNRGPTGPNS